jgi:copper chaperone CopZ
MTSAMAVNQKVELKVLGMACGGCSAAVEKALKNLQGVASARVDLAKKTAYVDYDSGKLTIEDLKKAIQNAGYKVG